MHGYAMLILIYCGTREISHGVKFNFEFFAGLIAGAKMRNFEYAIIRVAIISGDYRPREARL